MSFSFLILSSLIAFTSQSNWEELSFGSVPPNRTTFGESSLKVEVNDSASPLLHLFPAHRHVTSLRLAGTVRGNWSLPTGSSWKDSPDDALLRIGLIQSGTRRLNPIERLAAPDWIRHLEAQTSEGVGRIHCFHLMPDGDWIGESRDNPNADIFYETIQAAPNEDGSFEMMIELEEPIETVGLWLLADGDDSGSSFTVEIATLEIDVTQ